MRDVYEGANLDIPTPASLKPGKYLLRHEMINLQTGPVQFFPNCIQLEVRGSGSSLPAPDELVAIASAYEKVSPTYLVSVSSRGVAFIGFEICR